MKQLLKFSASWCQPCKQLSGVFKHVDLKEVELKEIDIEEMEDGVDGANTGNMDNLSSWSNSN